MTDQSTAGLLTGHPQVDDGVARLQRTTQRNRTPCKQTKNARVVLRDVCCLAVCPEPVLANDRFSSDKTKQTKQTKQRCRVEMCSACSPSAHRVAAHRQAACCAAVRGPRRRPPACPAAQSSHGRVPRSRSHSPCCLCRAANRFASCRKKRVSVKTFTTQYVYPEPVLVNVLNF